MLNFIKFSEFLYDPKSYDKIQIRIFGLQKL